MPKRKKPLELNELIRTLRRLPAVQELLQWDAEAKRARMVAERLVKTALARRGLSWFAKSSSIDWLLHSDPPEQESQTERVQPLNLPEAPPAILQGALGAELLALPRVKTWLVAHANAQAARATGQSVVDAVCGELETREKARLAVRLALRRRGYAEPFIRNFQLDYLIETTREHHVD